MIWLMKVRHHAARDLGCDRPPRGDLPRALKLGRRWIASRPKLLAWLGTEDGAAQQLGRLPIPLLQRMGVKRAVSRMGRPDLAAPQRRHIHSQTDELRGREVAQLVEVASNTKRFQEPAVGEREPAW